jgi:hypothetical protein
VNCQLLTMFTPCGVGSGGSGTGSPDPPAPPAPSAPFSTATPHPQSRRIAESPTTAAMAFMKHSPYLDFGVLGSLWRISPSSERAVPWVCNVNPAIPSVAGDVRPHWGIWVPAVKGQCAELPQCPQMSCFAAMPEWGYNRVPRFVSRRFNQEYTMGEASPGIQLPVRPPDERLDSFVTRYFGRPNCFDAGADRAPCGHVSLH